MDLGIRTPANIDQSPFRIGDSTPMPMRASAILNLSPFLAHQWVRYCRNSDGTVESRPGYDSLPLPCRTKFECNNETNLRPILESFAAAGLDGAGPKKPEVR